MTNALEKIRDESLHEVDCAEREKRNVGLCKCISNQINGNSVLLIDDVNTCGVTLKRCAEELKKAGAKDVRAFVCGITYLR
jgi:predicted amidophosphoribosyltransferase